MSKKIYYVNPQSQYDVLTKIQLKILKEFENYGYTPTLRTENEVPDLKKDAFFNFNGVYPHQELISIKENLINSYSESYITSDLVGISFYVDDPVYHILRYNINMAFPNTIYYTMNKNHNFFIEKFFKVKPKFIGHIGTKGDSIEFNKKEYDFFIAGTFENVDEMIKNFKSTLSESEIELFEDIFDTMCAREDLHYYDFIETFLENMNLDINKQILIYQKYSPIKKIYRALHRESLLMAITSLGYNVVLAGNIANPILKDLENVTYVGNLDYDTMLDYVTKSKFVLNSTPTYKYGVTERALDAMLRKTVVLSNESLFLKEFFKDMENVITYNLTDISDLKEKIDSIINNEEKYTFMVDKAYKIAENYSVESFVKMAVQDIEKTQRAIELKNNAIF